MLHFLPWMFPTLYMDVYYHFNRYSGGIILSLM